MADRTDSPADLITTFLNQTNPDDSSLSSYAAVTGVSSTKRLAWISSSDEEPSEKLNELPSLVSLLTRLTASDSDPDEAESKKGEDSGFCLAMVTESNSQVFEDNKFNFPRNEDPGIEEYMSLVELDY